MEEAIVSAITDDTSEAKITVAGVADRPGVAATLFRELADGGINVDMIVQNTSAHAVTDISFTVAKTDLDAAMAACRRVQGAVGAETVSSDDNIGRVTVVGGGMKSSPGVTALMFETLSSHGINIEMISTSSIRLSCVIRAEHVNDAVRFLHSAFGLDAD